MQIWAESGKSALPICNYSQILYQFLTFTQNLKRSRFFTRFHISSALKAANAYKRKGTPVTEIFQYMFLLIFSNRSMYMSLLTGKNTPNFAKATLT